MAFKLIIGLGNDEPTYANTYHNAGHLFVDYIHNHYPDFRAEKTAGYMNESGVAAARAMKRANAAPEETLIVHDESDLSIGEYKISSDRGSAGHKGVQSVFDVTGATNFTRLRIGIRPNIEHENRKKAGVPAEAHRAKAGEFVLKRIPTENREILEVVFKKASEEMFGAPEQ